MAAPSRINLTLSGADRVDAQRRKYVGEYLVSPETGDPATIQGTLGGLIDHLNGCTALSVFVLCRQRALKALDERLSKTGGQPQTWPSLEDTGSSQDEQDLSPPSSQPPPVPPPDSVVVEKVPGGETAKEGERRGDTPNPTSQPPVKTDSAS